MTLIAVGQLRSHQRTKAMKQYFKSRELKAMLVCDDLKTMEYWIANFDKSKYEKFEIVNLQDFSSTTTFLSVQQIRDTVKMAGVMKYPCLLTLVGDQIKGKYFIDSADSAQ